MKRLIIWTSLMFAVLLTSCNSTTHTTPKPEFDWMPSELMWQNNIRNCRSQPQCNAADLFARN